MILSFFLDVIVFNNLFFKCKEYCFLLWVQNIFDSDWNEGLMSDNLFFCYSVVGGVLLFLLLILVYMLIICVF